MTSLEEQPRGILSLVTESDRSNPRVTQVVNLLGDKEIVNTLDLINIAPETLKAILPDTPRYPYSPRVLGQALRAIAVSYKRGVELDLQLLERDTWGY